MDLTNVESDDIIDAWVTRYALEDGLQLIKLEVYIHPSLDNKNKKIALFYPIGPPHSHVGTYYFNNEVFSTKEEAAKEAVRMQKVKILSLYKEIHRLSSLNFMKNTS